MGNTSLYGNRGLIRIGRRSQGCAHSMSMPDFQIPHQDLSRPGGTKSSGVLIFAMGSPTCSWTDENASLLCPPPPGDAAAHSPGLDVQSGSPFSCVSRFVMSPMSPNWIVSEIDMRNILWKYFRRICKRRKWPRSDASESKRLGKESSHTEPAHA